MITIHKSGKITIPQEEGFIGYAGDNLNKTLEFTVENHTDENCYYRAFLKFDDDTVNYFILNKKIEKGNTILIWTVTQDQLYKNGIVYLQIKAFNSNNVIFHTESVPIFVGDSIEFTDYLSERPNSEFLQQEEQLNQLLYDVENAKEFLPYIGENGNWFVYDYDTKSYYDTSKTALGSAEKYPLTTEITESSTDDNASSAKAVYNYGRKIYSDSKDYFSTNAGNIEYLNTKDKSSLVNAVNELNAEKISNTKGSVTKDNLSEELLQLINSGGGSSGGSITDEQLNKLVENKEDISNKITAFDSLLTNKDKYPTAIAVINYLKDYYYNYEEIDGMLAELGSGITEEDLANLKAELSQIETPTFANSVDECTDTSKLYVLPDGFIYACMEKAVDENIVPNFVNQLPISQDIDSTEPFGETGYMTGKYLSSSSPFYGNGATNDWVTGCIPYTVDKTIYIKGTSFTTASHDRMYFFIDKTERVAPSITGSNIETYFMVEQLDVDYYKLTPISGSSLPDTAQYIRMSFTTGTPSEVIITVDEEITYTTTEGGTVQQWGNTGLAFVPADYEDRIIDLENDTDNLKADVSNLKTFCETGEIVPENVITEVSNLVDKALSREDTRMLRFLISSDAHQKNDHELITKGTKELAQAHGEILKLISVDFVASLGDVTWGSSASDNATVLEEAKAFNKLMLPNIRGEKQIWTEGNHETGMLTDTQIQALIYSHNKDLVQNNDQWIDGYGYMDFPNQKVRVICINTDQATGNDSSGVSDTQLKWLAETALDMSDKTDWSVITFGHHPISFNNITLMKNCAYVIEAFILGSNFSFTTNGGTEINIDYSNKNCQYVAHFHGHAHSYSVVKMQKRLDSGEYAEFDAWEICIPNACYERNNQYKDNGTYTERYSTETTYNKEDVDGKRTSFNLITVCLDKKTIYADNYGAGIDREVNYN